MAAGMDVNGFGRVVTCDPRLLWVWLNPRIEFQNCRSDEIARPTEPVDLLFIDSDLEVRAKEFEWFRPLLSHRALVLFHDTGETHPQMLAEVRALVDSGQLEGAFLPTPRGLFIGRPKAL